MITGEEVLFFFPVSPYFIKNSIFLCLCNSKLTIPDPFLA